MSQLLDGNNHRRSLRLHGLSRGACRLGNRLLDGCGRGDRRGRHRIRRRRSDFSGGFQRFEQTVALGSAPHTVGLSFDDARRVGLDSDAEREAEIERLLVAQAELFGELVDADLAWQCVPPSGRARAARSSWESPQRNPPRLSKPSDLAQLHVGAQCPGKRAAAFGGLQAGDVVAQPGTPSGSSTEDYRPCGTGAHAPHG